MGRFLTAPFFQLTMGIAFLDSGGPGKVVRSIVGEDVVYIPRDSDAVTIRAKVDRSPEAQTLTGGAWLIKFSTADVRATPGKGDAVMIAGEEYYVFENWREQFGYHHFTETLLPIRKKRP